MAGRGLVTGGAGFISRHVVQAVLARGDDVRVLDSFAGVESLTAAGRDALHKDCRIGTDDLTGRLILARRHVPFVQANLIATAGDNAAEIAAWREQLRGEGIWANDPVPLFPYPGAPEYRARWGLPDDAAWERAHAHHLAEVKRFSDIQAAAPLPLAALQAGCGA